MDWAPGKRPSQESRIGIQSVANCASNGSKREGPIYASISRIISKTFLPQYHCWMLIPRSAPTRTRRNHIEMYRRKRVDLILLSKRPQQSRKTNWQIPWYMWTALWFKKVPRVQQIVQRSLGRQFERNIEMNPSCAICDDPPFPECPFEGVRLRIAIRQAEKRTLERRLTEIRCMYFVLSFICPPLLPVFMISDKFEFSEWVISHAREHVLKYFECLATVRKVAHAQYMSSLPNYATYTRYSRFPTIHQALLNYYHFKSLKLTLIWNATLIPTGGHVSLDIRNF